MHISSIAGKRLMDSHLALPLLKLFFFSLLLQPAPFEELVDPSLLSSRRGHCLRILHCSLVVAMIVPKISHQSKTWRRGLAFRTKKKTSFLGWLVLTLVCCWLCLCFFQWMIFDCLCSCLWLFSKWSLRWCVKVGKLQERKIGDEVFTMTLSLRFDPIQSRVKSSSTF